MIDEGLLRDLMRIYGSLTYRVIEKIFEPPNRLYLRVNTLLITRGELIDRLRSKGIRVFPDPYIEEAIYIVIEGPYKIPLLDKTIIVDRYAAESVMLGANLYRPGILKHDHFRKGEYLTILSPNNKPIAIGEAIVSSEELRNMSSGIVVKTIKSLYRAPPIRDLEEYERGLFYPQSLPSMIVSKILNPEPGELIIDMNAAPGGKTSHIVQITRGMGRVIAFDRNLKKILRVFNTLNRLKLFRNTVLLPMDSRYIHIDLELGGRADKVLIDPPCTGLGVRPKILIDKNLDDAIRLSNYQRQFLNTAYHIVRRKGLVAYSTCTLTFIENESNIEYAVEKLGFETVEIETPPYAEKVYYGDITAYRYSPLSYNMPGYFISLLRKT
jgi:predicted RNA-binding protein (TIGR00451 family)